MHTSESATVQPVTWFDAGRRRDEALWDAVHRAMTSMLSVGTAGAGRRITIGDSSFQAQIVRAATPAPIQPVVVLLFPESASTLPSGNALQATFGLTPRESEVALLLADRRSNKEIARELNVTLFTAERHAERVLAKLGINSRRLVRATLLAAS